STKRSGARRGSVQCVPFIEAVIPDYPLQHGLNLFIGLLYKAISDQLPNHSSSKPGPVASVLISVRIHPLVLEKTLRVGRVECQADGGSTRFVDIPHHGLV